MVSARLAYPLTFTTQKANAFYAAFVISLALVSVPIKNFAYIVPPVYLLFQALNGNRQLISRVIGVEILAVLVSSFSLLFDSYRLQVNLPGMLLALLTYLPIVIAVCHPPISLSDEGMRRLQTTCAWFVIVQSFIGFGQFAIARHPDTVCGTFGLFDFHHRDVTIAQVFYTFTLFSMLLFMLLDAKRRLVQVAIGIGLVACVLAQSGHQTVFFVASLGGFAMIRVTRPKFVITTLVGIVTIAALVQFFYPETFNLAWEWQRKVRDDSSPKRMAVEAGFTIMDDSKNLLLGTGLGQFTSRAALITSNQYLSRGLPEFLVGKSTYYSQHIEPASLFFQDYGEGSAIYKPYCSLLSICVEMGLIGSLLLGVMFATQLFRNAKFMRHKQPWISLSGTLANVGIVFFALCCTIENYAEFAQAVFLPVLLYVAVTSRAKTLEGERKTAAGGVP